MMKPSLPLILFIAALLSSCVNAPNLPANSPISIDGDDAVIILAVKPDYKISFAIGSTEAEKWTLDEFSFSAITGFPKNGYIVAKVPATTEGNPYGLTQIHAKGVPGGFIPCRGNKIITFEAPAGQVTYIGDIELERKTPESSKISYTYSSDSNRVRKYLAENYPELASKVEVRQGKELILAKSECEAGHYLFVGGAMLRIPGQQRDLGDQLRTYGTSYSR